MPHAEIKQRRLHYLEGGAGFPVLFGHSFLWDAEMWRPQLDALSSTYRCIVPDLWGHGSSDPVAGSSYSLDRLADDYIQFADALGLERFAVVGLSIGGMWGFRMALKLPERVAGLVLMGTDVGAEPAIPRLKFNWMIRVTGWLRRLSPRMIRAMMPLFFADETLNNRPHLLDRFQTQLSSVPPERLPGILAVGRGIFSRPDLTGRLSEIRCPARVIVGEQDRSRPPWEAKRMADGISRADLHVLPQAGHICNLEAPDRVTELLQEFLGRI